MDLEELDRMIAARKNRVEKRKEDGTLFEEEVSKNEPEDKDAQLAREVEDQKAKMLSRMQAQIPPCPQCGKKMTLNYEEGMILCEDCQVGMRIPM